jgi:hypothetical protein
MRSLMPYKHRDPVPESEMGRERYQGHHTICQILRDTYHLTEDSTVKINLRLAMAYAKAMNEKLQHYRHLEEQGRLQILEEKP